MCKLKTSFNSYVLDPNDPSTLGGIDNIFGYRVIVRFRRAARPSWTPRSP